MNRADTQGCVDTHPPESQLSECQKYSGDKPWSPGFRSEKPCDTGRASWLETHRRVRA